LDLLLFGEGAGPASAGFGGDWMLWGGIATIVAGVVGMLGARDLGKLAGYNVIISSGTLLGAVGLQQPAATAGALAYLVVSTLGSGALSWFACLFTRDVVEEDVYSVVLDPFVPVEHVPRGAALYGDEVESRVVIPAPVAMLGARFLLCALLLAGLPLLSG